MRARRMALAVLLVAVAVAAAPRPAGAQVSSARLISEGREWLGRLEADSAANLLRRVVAPQSGATPEERLRAFVLLAVAELAADRSAAANAWADSAIALSPGERADSLEQAGLAAGIIEVFTGARRRLVAHRVALEFQNVPVGAELRVNGVLWTTTRAELPPGPVLVEVSRRGYRTWTDSFDLEAARPQLRALPALTRAEAALLTVSAEPAGTVVLGDERVGETPLIAKPVEPGRFTLRVLSATGDTIAAMPVELEPGRPRVLGGLGRGAPEAATGVAAADSLYRAAAFDAALVVYAAELSRRGADLSAERRARILYRMGALTYAMGRARGQPATLDSARAVFRAAVRLAPALAPAPVEYAPGFRAAMDSARARVLLVAAEPLRDTIVALQGARVHLVVHPTLPSWVVLMVARAGAPTAPRVYVDSQAVASANGAAAFDWTLRDAAGPLAAGRFALLVLARDSAGQMSQLLERVVAVERVAVDTAAHPAPPSTSDVLPESVTVRPRSLSGLAIGIAVAGVVAALPSAMGHADLNRGLGNDATAYAVAGVLSVATIAGYFGGTRPLARPDNAEHNRRLREQYEVQLNAVIQQNRRLRDDAGVHLHFEGSP